MVGLLLDTPGTLFGLTGGNGSPHVPGGGPGVRAPGPRFQLVMSRPEKRPQAIEPKTTV
jgi:hypothetical protein